MYCLDLKGRLKVKPSKKAALNRRLAKPFYIQLPHANL
jgi:hypothetical protein